jgi:lipopolysaccharide transport system ATP-binding protein
MSSNSEFSVRVEGLGKRYLVPHRHESAGRMGKVAAHMREFFPLMGRDERDFFWALRDLSFEVKPGEILGILGRNGSGKSTLLKILSCITQPTTGRAVLRGRVGSLLEVGTGFHPDLTGRENVFMSGSMLGISKKEVVAKFDEIVAFSGIEPFIDMPVKRYSSGMYVRLAYAVTSLLRADVLILDEVMAVGDAEFREKSQKNIESISQDGRTVIVVSHNVPAIRKLCSRGIFLEKGQLVMDGVIEEVAAEYMRRVHAFCGDEHSMKPFVDISMHPGLHRTRDIRILKWIETSSIEDGPSINFKTGQNIKIRIGFDLASAPLARRYYASIFFIDADGNRTMVASSLHDKNFPDFNKGGVLTCEIDDNRFVDGKYAIMVDFGIAGPQNFSLDCVPHAQEIAVLLGEYLGAQGLRSNQGFFAQKTKWGYGLEG